MPFSNFVLSGNCLETSTFNYLKIGSFSLAYQIESGNCFGNKNGYCFFKSGKVFGVAAAYDLSKRSISKSIVF